MGGAALPGRCGEKFCPAGADLLLPGPLRVEKASLSTLKSFSRSLSYSRSL